MDLLNFYLLAGLVTHKVVGEVMKGHQRQPLRIRIFAGSWIGRLARLAKVCILVAVATRVRLGDNWTDIETAGVLERQELVEAGVYRYIRHPLYLGDLLLLAGFELALNSWLALGVLVLAPLILRQAREEEKVLLANLPGYRDYCARTKRFIPFLA